MCITKIAALQIEKATLGRDKQRLKEEKEVEVAKVAGLKMQGSGGLHGLLSDTCEDRNVGMQGRSENVAHARAIDGLRLRRASQLQAGFDNCAADDVCCSGKHRPEQASAKGSASSGPRGTPLTHSQWPCSPLCLSWASSSCC